MTRADQGCGRAEDRNTSGLDAIISTATTFAVGSLLAAEAGGVTSTGSIKDVNDLLTISQQRLMRLNTAVAMFFFRNDKERSEVCVGTASQAVSRAERIVQAGSMPCITRANGEEVTIVGLIAEAIAEKRKTGCYALV